MAQSLPEQTKALLLHYKKVQLRDELMSILNSESQSNGKYENEDELTREISSLKSKLISRLKLEPQRKTDEERNENLFLSHMTHNQKICMTTALSIDLIIDLVLQNLCHADLLTTRLVSIQWSRLSTLQLVSKNSGIIRLNYSPKLGMYIHSPRSYNYFDFERRTMSGLHSLLEKSTGFPCTAFRFEGGDLGTPVPLLFFRAHGAKMKHVEFAHINPGILNGEREDDGLQELIDIIQSTSKTTFCSILHEFLSHVESLTLFQLNDYTGDEDRTVRFDRPNWKGNQLVNLRCVKYDEYSQKMGGEIESYLEKVKRLCPTKGDV